jgi:hypothetical protein
MIVAGLLAVLVGYSLSATMDKLFLKRLVPDRISAIALSCACAFVLMMAGATFFLTKVTHIESGPIIVPPLGYAVSFVIGLAAVGIIRIRGYADEYARNDDEIVFDPDYNDLSRYDAEILAFEERHGAKNYLRRHWAGCLPLTVSYWVNGTLLWILLVIAAEFLIGRMRSGGGSLRLLAAAGLIYLATSLLFWLWSSVGIWRSAYWHRRRGGSAGWGVAARTLVLLAAVATVFRSGDIALQAAELGNLAAGKDSVGEIAEMTASRDGRELFVRGSIASGSADRLRTLLESSPKAQAVVLNSPGGRLLEAERMAAMIRQRGLDTRVEDYCMSACTDLLLAGRERTAPEEARIGFHQPSFPGVTAGELRAETEEWRARYLAAGVDGGFVARALLTPAEDMWYPRQETLLEAHVLTGSELVVTGATEGEAGRRAEASRKARVARELEGFAAQINRAAPLRVDAVTTLDRASASGVTLTNVFSVRSVRADLSRARSKMLRVATWQACRNPQMASAIRNGATLVYSYRRSTGDRIFDVAVDRCPRG